MTPHLATIPEAIPARVIRRNRKREIGVHGTSGPKMASPVAIDGDSRPSGRVERRSAPGGPKGEAIKAIGIILRYCDILIHDCWAS